MNTRPPIDAATETAVRRFASMLEGRFPVAGVILFGSRARNTHRPDSDADVAVLTNVGADHTDFIGDWRSRIASEKAGIVKPGSIAVLGTDASDVIAHVEADEGGGGGGEI
mgnify:CR=1 FL=1